MAGTKQATDDATQGGTAGDTSAVEPADQRLEKVQELLFGPRSRELESATAQLAVRLDQSLTALKKDTDEWRETVMTHITHEVSELKKQIRKEQQARTKALKAALEELERVHTDVLERIEQVDATSKSADEDMQSSLDACTAELRSELEHARAELASATEQVSSDLSHDKADRAALSGLFKHVAEQLQAETGASV